MQIQNLAFERLNYLVAQVQHASNVPQHVESSVVEMGTADMAPQQHVQRRDVAENVARRDGLPEHHDYRDDGCNLYPSCLACPLPRCRYDAARGQLTLEHEERRERVLALRRDGLSVADVATMLGVSRRTVFRLSRA